jgi:hypothetical protein
MRSTTTPLLLFSLAFHTTSTIAQKCYNQQGVEDTSLVPCNAGGGCCPPGDICWSNGFCKGENVTNDFFYYVGCTNPAWDAAGCVPQCLGATTGTGVQVCPGNTNGAGHYCCLGFESSCDCDDPALAVTIPSGNIVTTVALDYFDTVSASSTGSASASSATSATSTRSSLADKSSSAATTATSIAVASAVPKDSGDSEGLSTGAKAGVGVGAAAAAVAIVGALIFFMRRHGAKSRRDHAAEMEEKRQIQGGGESASGGEGSYYSPVKSPLPPCSDNARQPLIEAPDTSLKWRNDQAPVEAP